MRSGRNATAALRILQRHRLLCTTPSTQPVKRTVTATVLSLDEEGDAVATCSETTRQLRVPFAVPGDVLNASVWERDVASNSRHAMFAQLLGIQQPSAHRVDAPCAKFFGACGGCKHQNVRYAQQLVEKQQRMRQLFASIDMREPIREIIGVASPEATYRYRNKMEFTCSTGRWLLDNDTESSAFTVGMFPVASVGTRRAKAMKKHKRSQWNSRILSIDQCLLQDAACDELLARITSLSESLELHAYDFDSHLGFLKNLILRRGTVRSSDGDGEQKEIMIGFITTTLEGEQQQRLETLVDTLVEELVPTIPVVSIVQHLDEEALRHRVKREGLSASDVDAMEKRRVLFGQDHYHDSILGHQFQVSLDSFFQPNSSQASALYAVVQQELAQYKSKPVVWDLFCGVGSIGICMGKHVKRLYGFELVEAAVEKARHNAALNGYDDRMMQFQCLDLASDWRDIEDQLLRLQLDPDTRPDVVIVDPPRAGLHKKLATLLRRLAPPRICYVSCNPHTQVRDLELLTADGDTARYTVEYLQPVDMLPHTPHIETVAWLSWEEQ